MNVLAENLESVIDDVVQRKRGLSDRLLGDEDDHTIDTVYKDDSYINKRRKLGLCESRVEAFAASHHDNDYIAAAGAPISSNLDNISTAPSNTQQALAEPLIRPFLLAMRSGSITEAIVPPSFSIKIRDEGLHLSTHNTVRSRAYHLILRFLRASDLLSRSGEQIMNSRKKNRWTCLFLIVANEECKWLKEGAPGQYACQTCMKLHRPCIVVIEGQMFILPLAPSLRAGTGAIERGFVIVPEGVKAHKTSFFR